MLIKFKKNLKLTHNKPFKFKYQKVFHRINQELKSNNHKVKKVQLLINKKATSRNQKQLHKNKTPKTQSLPHQSFPPNIRNFPPNKKNSEKSSNKSTTQNPKTLTHHLQPTPTFPSLSHPQQPGGPSY